MRGTFQKLKMKFLRNALLFSAAVGISCGLFLAGVLLLSFHLGSVSLHWGYYVLIGVSAALSAGGISYAFLHPTDRKIAKNIDGEFGLNEKVQTMVACADESGMMVEIQREDTLEILKSIPVAKPKWKRVFACAVAVAVACAMFFAAVGVSMVSKNADAETPPYIPVKPDEDPVYEYDLYQQSAMAELISDVRASSLEDKEKQSVIGVLNDLDASLKKAERVSAMKTAVFASVAVIDSIVDDANSCRKISAELLQRDELIAGALLKGTGAYKVSASGLTQFDRVKALELRLGSLVDIAVELYLQTSYETLAVEEQSQAELGEKIKALVSAIRESLLASDIAETDPLYASLYAFTSEVKKVNEKIDKGFSDATLLNDLKDDYAAFRLSLVEALQKQSYRLAMNVFIRQKLAVIFDLSYEELPEMNDAYLNGGGEIGDPDEEDPDNNQGDGGGGIGDNEEKYGGDDLIFNPDTREHEKYGNVLDEYYAKALDRILSGEIPQETAQYILDYFDILYSGIKTEDKGEE